MRSKTGAKLKQHPPELVMREGKPTAVIVPLDQYREMLERLDDVDDLKALDVLRKKPLRFRTLDAFLKETRRRV